LRFLGLKVDRKAALKATNTNRTASEFARETVISNHDNALVSIEIPHVESVHRLWITLG
jgi:hypothetical protein